MLKSVLSSGYRFPRLAFDCSLLFKSLKYINQATRTRLLSNNPIQYQIETKGGNRPKKNAIPLSHSKYESKDYKLPKWKESLGEFIISIFRLDMDRVRAGPVAGSYYYNICRSQGFQVEDEELSPSAKYFYETLRLPRTFSQWFQITVLHEWMLFTRMRAMPSKYGRNYQQKLVDRTFSDIELRLFDEMNIHSGRIVDQYLKDFDTQLKGAVLAYDEGFYSDDSTLATAVWRNLFAGRKNIDMSHLEDVVKYIRSQLYILSKMSDREFALGKFNFVLPTETVKILTPEEELQIKKSNIEKYEKLEKSGLMLPSEKSNLSYTN